ncbi:MAG: glycosyltransferase family 4 protein [Myxococcota bacterium]|nr:glycosyltransferase family 4 protein [Myxococcota bacterium]
MLNERDRTHPLAGGVEVHLDELAGRLAERHGIQTTVLCSGYEGAVAEETRNGVHYVRFGGRFSYYAKLPGRARAHWRTGDYDLVVENLCKLLFFSQLYLPGAPHLALVHHLFGLSAFRQVPIPIAAYVALTESLLPILYRRWPYVVVSPSTRDDLRARFLPADQIRVIPNGLDHARFRPDEAVAVEPGLVLFVGRLEYYKGVDVLLDAWDQVVRSNPDARLVLVGAGTAEADLRARLKDRPHADSVRFEGFVSEEEKVRWLQRAEVLVQPSHKEGWGLTVLEANACGTPVVATRVPGLQDSVRDGETGLLVERSDPSALAGAIDRVLTDSALRSRLSAGAVAWAGRFSWDAVADAFATVLTAVARREVVPEVRDFLTSRVER